MSRYLIILVCACTPLVALIGRDYVDMAAAPGASAVEPEHPSKDVQPAEAAAAAKTSALRDRDMVRQMIDPDALAREVGDSRQGLAPLMADVTTARRACRAAVDFLEKAGQLPLKPIAWKSTDTPGWLAELEAQVKALRAFLADNASADGIRRKDQFLGWLREQIAEVEAEREVVRILQEARSTWSNSQYAEYYRKCATMDVSRIRNTETRQWLQSRLAYAKGVALYCEDKRQLETEIAAELAKDASLLDEAEVTRQLERINTFLERHPAAPVADMQAFQGSVARRQADLFRRLRFDERQAQLSKELARLNNTTSLPQLLKQAFGLALKLNNGDEHLWKSGRETIAHWLANTAFPTKRLPDTLPGHLEALTKDGRRKIGEFAKSPEGERWRFWRWDGPKDRQAHPDGEEQVEIIAPPDTPKYVRWADRFNSESRKLAAKATRQEWLAFLHVCEEMQNQLQEYRRLWGTDQEPDRSCAQWSFLPDPKVFPDARLSELARQLERLQETFAN
jgi:hypothetical protein